MSFDVSRERDLQPSLAVASLIAFLRAQPEYGRSYVVDHHSARVDGVAAAVPRDIADDIERGCDLSAFDLVALAAYAWSETLLAPLMSELRSRGFGGDYVLGGYQVTREEPIEELYPDARYLIVGPGERELLQVLVDPPTERVLVGAIAADEIISPYLIGIIDVPAGAPMARMETKRGCRWRCTFCAYHGLREHKLVPLPLARVRAELELFVERGVRKINVIDPEFNGRAESCEVLRTMIDAGLQARVSVQARPENLVRMRWSDEYLDLCEELDVCLEFGLQTAIQAESDAVRRQNDYGLIARALGEVRKRGIDHEVSLIYGLPLQTVESFATTLEWVKSHGVGTIHCFPLMLTRGTALSRGRELYGLQEEVLDGFGIPFVTSSSTFSRDEWEEMRRMGEAASANADRCKRPAPVRAPVGESGRRAGDVSSLTESRVS